jgi:hypothetical protein
MDDLKAASASEVAELARKGRELGLNRLLDPEYLSLDPEGVNIFILVLFDHQAFNRDLPVHHRVRALLKVTGSMTPVERFFDLTAEDWDGLPSLEQLKQAT